MADTLEHTIVVRGVLPDIYNLWANFENFPRFMKHIRSVTLTGEGTSHWVMQGPLGTTAEWDAQITRLEPNRIIGWESLPGSEVETGGQVTFTERGVNETEVTVRMHYRGTPGGGAGELLAQVFANPQALLEGDLNRFKEHVESTSERLHEGDAVNRSDDDSPGPDGTLAGTPL